MCLKICFIKKVNSNIKNTIKDKNSKLIYIVILCFSIAICLIVLSFYLVTNAANEIKNGIDLNNEEFIKKIKSYYLEYEVTVYGNKTINRYSIKEKYDIKDEYNEYFKFDIKGENKKNITYEFNNNSLTISSENQLNIYNIENYDFSKTNLFSLYTFYNLYIEIKNSECNCENYIFEEEDKDNLIYGIVLYDKCEQEVNLVNYNRVLTENNMNISKIVLVISKNTKIPIKYIGYDEEENTYFEVEYKKVEIK